jgi:hypothetical protein
MPSLQVRDLPEAIYRKLLNEAEKEHRSLAQQAIAVLAIGLGVSNAGAPWVLETFIQPFLEMFYPGEERENGIPISVHFDPIYSEFEFQIFEPESNQ